MEQPSEKLKKTLLIVGITGVVYGTFKYLLPLVVPFLFSYMIALALKSSASWLAGKLKIKFRGKCYGVPIGLIGLLELLFIIIILGVLIYFGGQKLWTEANLFLRQIPSWIEQLDHTLTGLCYRIEIAFALETNVLVHIVQDMLNGFLTSAKGAAMAAVVGNSMIIFQSIAKFLILVVVVLVAVMLSLNEIDSLKKRRERSIYGKEFAMLSERMVLAGNAYLRSQGVIILFTTVICTVVLLILKNPYYLLAGIGIGLLDALPLFGAGTVLVPWAITLFIQGHWSKGIIILILFAICYILREILETKLMGERVGLTPLETFVAMYVGLQLFGLLGFILGPIGLLIIEDMVKHFMT